MADNRKYRPNTAVYGNLAYDLDALVRQRELEEAGKMPPVRKPEPAMRPRTAARQRQKVSPLALGGLVLLAAMAITLLLGYVQLTRITASVNEIKAELSQLDDQHVALLTKYEQTYDLATVKEMAEASGMDKPIGGQIEYIDLSGSDSAKVYRTTGKSAVSDLLGAAKRGVDSVVEYFR